MHKNPDMIKSGKQGQEDIGMEYKIIQTDDRTWIIDNMGVRCFLLAGEESALLIDCGMTLKNVAGIVQELTDLPFRLLITHADADHIGDIASFDHFYMHPAEAAFFYHPSGPFSEKAAARAGKDYEAVWEGDRIELGNRTLEIIHIPGHTPGSIGVLDLKNRTLYAGDPVQQNGQIYMFGGHREMHTYIKALRRLEKMNGRFDYIIPSHADYPLDSGLIGKLADAAEEIQAGKRAFEEGEAHGWPVKVYDVGTAVFLLDR